MKPSGRTADAKTSSQQSRGHQAATAATLAAGGADFSHGHISTCVLVVFDAVGLVHGVAPEYLQAACLRLKMRYALVRPFGAHQTSLQRLNREF